MTVPKRSTVAVVDDDEAVRDALSNLLASLDLGVATFASAEAFLASPACRAAACLIADVQMPGMSGLDLQRHLAEQRQPPAGHPDHRLPAATMSAGRPRPKAPSDSLPSRSRAGL